LNIHIGRSILEFFLERYAPGLFLHFEMIPDRLPNALREPIARFPAGALQFEVGVQTFNEEVSARISRRQDNAKLADNLRFLREQTGVHVHADLIVGLPGEGIDSFAAGFDRLRFPWAAGDPGRHARSVCVARRSCGTMGIQDGLQPASAVRNPPDPDYRLRDHAAPAAVGALGPDRQQRELHRIDAAQSGRAKRIGLRAIHGAQRLALRDGRSKAWLRARGCSICCSRI
jgi:hypothetical protein